LARICGHQELSSKRRLFVVSISNFPTENN